MGGCFINLDTCALLVHLYEHKVVVLYTIPTTLMAIVFVVRGVSDCQVLRCFIRWIPYQINHEMPWIVTKQLQAKPFARFLAPLKEVGVELGRQKMVARFWKILLKEFLAVQPFSLDSNGLWFLIKFLVPPISGSQRVRESPGLSALSCLHPAC